MARSESLTGPVSRRRTSISRGASITDLVSEQETFRQDDPRTFLTNILKFRETNFSVLYTAFFNHSKVVLKEMPFEKKRQKYILAEIEALTSLRSKFVVWLISAHRIESTVYAVMEYANVGSLSLLARYQVCDEPAVAYFILKILKCIEFIHIRGWLHRDLKSENIFLTDDGRVKLGDLGLSVRLRDTMNCSKIVGTPHWIAPEVIDNAEYSTASDVWGVGVICRELIEGVVPYAEIPPLVVLDMIQQSGLPPVRNSGQYSADLLDFLAKCNAVDPKNRATVRELVAHPFITKACSKTDIGTYITRAQEARSNDIFVRD
jgi:serine/threonine protein kinase